MIGLSIAIGTLVVAVALLIYTGLNLRKLRKGYAQLRATQLDTHQTQCDTYSKLYEVNRLGIGAPNTEHLRLMRKSLVEKDKALGVSVAELLPQA